VGGDHPTDEALRHARAAIEHCYAEGWTDGLPVVPPLDQFVDECLAWTDRDPDEVVLAQPHLDRACTVRLAAINAVMAGCRPEYFPVVLAALDAFAATPTAPTGLLQSTTGQAEILIVNGPIRGRLGLNSRGNVFGPGDRPNATIGRALRLVIMNALGIRPHAFDQSTHGTSAKYACCLAENEEESPWEPLHVERGFAREASTVTAQMIRGDVFVEQRTSRAPEEILRTIADTMSHAGVLTQMTERRNFNGAVVVLGPEHARILGDRGWSKPHVRRFLFEHFGRTAGDLRRFGKATGDLAGAADDAVVPFARSPEAIVLVVAGEANAGVSTVCPSLISSQVLPGTAAREDGSATREIVERRRSRA
jgi:hypothetical protein